MTLDDITASWASRFGLAASPLFGSHESPPAGSHNVLLDGGTGSFALSISQERLWKEPVCADWSWSCNLPHHVTITDDEVAVVRWDKSSAETFTRNSVESQISAFYSYLTSDRVESNKRVVEFMLKVYRTIRSLVANARLDDESSIDAYLAFLSFAMQRAQEKGGQSVRVYVEESEKDDLLRSLSQDGLDALFDEIVNRSSSDLSLSLVPSLAIRHAGSEIFQEAHFELLRAPSPDLFGRVGPAETGAIARGGAHFTPPALARTIVDQTLAQVSNLQPRRSLVILDPACGSGAFLHEALRALRRIGYEGRIILAGRDTSKPAISMARFVLMNAIADWCPKGGCEVQLEASDSLTAPLPRADVVLMNPPFVSWRALTSEQRFHMREVLGQLLSGRGDYCMAFVTRALETLSEGGALGTLLPGSLLALQGAEGWRHSISEIADVRFIASLGDYGLFRYAQVQVCAVVVAKRARSVDRPDKVVSLVTGSEAEATSVALRKLRRAANSTLEDLSEHGWHLFETPSHVFRKRPTWRLIVPSTEIALDRLFQSGTIAPVEELFSVRQGVRTGMNAAFIRTTSEWEALPEQEQRWFRPASVNDSIQSGTILSNHYIFYPYDDQGLAITSEEELNEEVPTYSTRYLRPARARLSERSSILRSDRSDWWGLSERRSWALDPSPRIVSKYFGGSGSFAVDVDATYVVVQGFAWMPKWADVSSDVEGDAAPFTLGMRELLAAYAVILNSDIVTRVLRLYSQHVAGGQYDLSWRFVRRMPIPNLPMLLSDERFSDVVVALSRIGQKQGSADPLHRHRTERLVTELYGSEFVRRI